MKSCHHTEQASVDPSGHKTEQLTLAASVSRLLPFSFPAVGFISFCELLSFIVHVYVYNVYILCKYFICLVLFIDIK